MGDAIAITKLEGAFVQENGIIRLADGRFIGRLDDITYGEVVERSKKSTEKEIIVKVESGKLEHLLNCMANQKFIHEQNAETQEEWQRIIDKSWNDGMALLHPPKAIEPSESAQ